ncbi:zinc dependent phospholipase C family protein, partial [Thermanaerothrix sp.]
MPKYAIHHIVLNDAIGVLLGATAAPARIAGAELAANMPIANIGAVGPDLLFWAPDYEIVDKFYTLYKNYAELRKLYNTLVQPIRDIRDAVVEPLEAAVETLAPSSVALIRHLIEEMKETAELFKKTVQTGLFAGVITGADLLTDAVGFPHLASSLFQMFVPPLQLGQGENCWYWFDMLHYRRTGEFGRRLVENARGGSAAQRAYAYGYLSHIATDLVGHAYVNQVVGGPFRLQVQRHVTVENWMDTWKFQQYYNRDINLHLLNTLGLPTALPSDVGDLLFKTLRDTYESVDHPRRLPGDGFLTRTQLDETYEIFYKVLELMRDQAVERPEEPFSGVTDILEGALDDLLEPPPSPPSLPSGACSLGDILSFGLTSSSRDCYESFFKELASWFEYIGELLAWAFETLLDLFDLLISLLLSLPIL